MPRKPSRKRTQGFVRRRGNSYEVIVYAGPDPLTGKDRYISRSTKDEREAERIRIRLLAQVDQQRSTATSATFGYVLDAWLKVHEVDPTTLAGYRRAVETRIKPALGNVPVAKVSARVLEELYAELRRCRVRCDGRPYVEHRRAGPHDCEAEDRSTRKVCKPHVCRPYAPATIRETHAIISAALSAAVRWEWIASNSADVAKKPKQTKPQPKPPSPEQAARIVRAATSQDQGWGTLVWLTMMTGARRGEIAALRWYDVDFERAVLEVRRSIVDGIEKGTKTHQMRRIALDEATVELLRAHRVLYEEQVGALDVEPAEDAFVFSNDPIHARPCDPDWISHRYKAMCKELGIETHLHALRHYSATELISGTPDISVGG